MTTRKIFVISGNEASQVSLSNRNGEEKEGASVESCINYRNGLRVVGTLCCCGLPMSILTLIPRHNSILEQSYWFEPILVAGFWIALRTAVRLMDFVFWFDHRSLITIQFFLKNYFAGFLTWSTTFIVFHTIWNRILEFNHPMPFIFVSCYVTTVIAEILALPFSLPDNCLEEEGIKKKFTSFSVYQILWPMVGIFNLFLGSMFKKLGDTDAQCIMALVVPFSKRVATYGLSKMMHKATGTENERANVSLAINIHASYGFFVATQLAGVRVTTVLCMAAFDFVIQLKMTYQIVKLHKKVSFNGHEMFELDKKKAISKLLLAESCEGLTPLVYAICFAMAYYGPNAELIGDVKNGCWQYNAIEDVSWTFLLMLWLFTVDFICLLLNSCILWKASNINLLNRFCSMMAKYWYIMALKLAHLAIFFFFTKDINLAVDLTYKFDWIKSDNNLTCF